MSGEFTYGHLEQDAQGGQSVEYMDMYPATHGLMRQGNQMAAQKAKDFYYQYKNTIMCGIAGVAGGAIIAGVYMYMKKKNKKSMSGHMYKGMKYSGGMYSNNPMSYQHKYF